MSEHTKLSNGAPQTLPLIVLDGAVVFPYTVMTLPLDDESAPAADAALKNGRMVLLVARRADADADAPLDMQLHRVGVVARIEQAGTLQSGVTGIVVRGIVRAVLGEQTQSTPHPRFSFSERPDAFSKTPELEELMTEVHATIDAVL